MYLRRYCTADLPALAELFHQTIHTINARDYSPEQLAVWSPGKIDAERWDRTLSEHYSIVAEIDGIPVGFGDIDATGYLDRLYVHSEHQGEGIASAICAKLEAYACALGCKTVTVHASITALPFFQKQGYRIIKEQQVERNGILLTNFVMIHHFTETQLKGLPNMERTAPLHSGELYLPGDEEIIREQTICLERLYDFNRTRPSEFDKRTEMLHEMFAEIGESCYIEPPLHANWGGKHVHFGSHVYANFNLTLVDDTHIYVGDYTMFGPNVTIATAGHPILPELREQVYQYNIPVNIGRNCWIGAGVVIVPGVSIGSNTVIGAGSVVTKDIPANVVAVGNPCRVLREIDDRDREYYYKDCKIGFLK